jgi:uncharacterized membrane protein YgcG
VTAERRTEPRRRLRSLVGATLSAVAVLLVWFALTFPDQLGRLTPAAFVRLPVEALLLVAVLLLLPRRWRRVVAALTGLALGLVVVLKIVDVGFYAVLGRAFNPVTDGSYLTSGVGVLRDSVGTGRTVAAVVLTVVALLAVLLLVLASVRRLGSLAVGHRAPAALTVSVLALVWLLCAALGVTTAGGRVAATATDGFPRPAADPALVADDPLAATPDAALLRGLRGKDVLLVFVESYGRVALEDPAIAPAVNAVLDRGTASLRAAGFSARSAFLTSPTYAGISWLAHGTLQSGLWIDNQQRYNELLRTDRLTLSGAFHRAGWRTVDDVPSNGQDWPEGQRFYHHDTIYDLRNVGYAGPTFGYASMPDQYTLAAFQRAELAAPRHAPVMAEIDLVSSHGPWAPLPRMVDWKALGDGSIFDPMPAQGRTPDELVGHPDQIKAAYGQSIQYSMSSLLSFVQTFSDDNLVVVAVGDHQPAAVVSGPDASRDVPITILAHDPRVLDRITSWGWQPGLRPDPQAPVWRMDAFRDRFLTAYGPSQVGRPSTSSGSGSRSGSETRSGSGATGSGGARAPAPDAGRPAAAGPR